MDWLCFGIKHYSIGIELVVYGYRIGIVLASYWYSVGIVLVVFWCRIGIGIDIVLVVDWLCV